MKKKCMLAAVLAGVFLLESCVVQPTPPNLRKGTPPCQEGSFNIVEREIAGWVCRECGHDQESRGGCEMCGGKKLKEVYYGE